MSEPSSLRSPLPLDALAPQVRRHLDPASPRKLRMMAAKGLVPMPPGEQIKALYVLATDEDPEIAEAAGATAGGLPDRILSAVLRGELPASVLDFMAERLQDQPKYLEMILLNHGTHDATFARLSRGVRDGLVDIIADNQLRLLREPDIIRGLHENTAVTPATLDRVVDFAVRAGLDIPDLESFAAARKRILGAAADRALAPEETAEGLIQANVDELGDEREDELPETRRVTLQQQILSMTVSEKIKLASIGNKEARTILLRDSNKLVQEAAIQSPRITEGEVVGLTHSRTIPDSVLRFILHNRDWMKNYQIKVNLINNPKTPLPTAIRLLPHLRLNDLRALSRNRNVPNALSSQAKALLQKKATGRGA